MIVLVVQLWCILWADSPAYEGFHVIEVWVESRSKGMRACGGQGSIDNYHQGQHKKLQWTSGCDGKNLQWLGSPIKLCCGWNSIQVRQGSWGVLVLAIVGQMHVSTMALLFEPVLSCSLYAGRTVEHTDWKGIPLTPIIPQTVEQYKGVDEIGLPNGHATTCQCWGKIAEPTVSGNHHP